MLKSLIEGLNGFVWGPPMLALLLGVGLYLTVRTGFLSIRKIPYAFSSLFRAGDPADKAGDVSRFGALMTAMSATVGTGNIGGVAAAIAIGGPGALFWMWVTALVGMATKYAEAVLAVSYRERDADGRTVGGPMYYIRNGMGPKWAWLGGLFATFGVFASFGTGNYIQAVSVADVMNTNYGVAPIVTGVAMLALAAAVILGGVKRIANVASKLVPAMAGAYMLAGLIIIAMNLGEVPGAFGLIVQRAFGFDAAAGGFVGALFWLAMQKGVARGIFSNEAGQGSAPIAHAAAKTNDPVDQGLVAMLGTFIDTLVVCTVTGLVILTTNVIPPECNALAILSGDALAAACDTGAPVTAAAFGAGLPGVGGHVVAIGLALFAFTTILGWSYYGERCAEFLFGERAVTPYRLIYLAIIPAAAMALYATGSDGDNDSVVNLIWLAVDTLTGLMAVPNLIALAALSPFIITLTRGYFRAKAEGRAQAFIDETVADRPRGGPAT